MENPFEEKVIHLLKKKGSLMTQEESPVFLLSAILEEFIFEYESSSSYALEVSFAKRLDGFLLCDDKTFYYDA